MPKCDIRGCRAEGRWDVHGLYTNRQFGRLDFNGVYCDEHVELYRRAEQQGEWVSVSDAPRDSGQR